MLHNPFHPALVECVNSFGSRPATGSAATKAGKPAAGTKAPVADETRLAVENKTVPDCSTEKPVLQQRVALWRLEAKSCSGADGTPAN